MFDIVISQSFLLVVICSALPLVCASLAGVLLAIIQTATQVQEQTLTFLVKFSVVGLVIALCSKLFYEEMILFFTQLLASLEYMGG